ncbi:MAG: alpha-amylase family glycosyl hydrolase [Gemmatimonadaceae bacterium]
MRKSLLAALAGLLVAVVPGAGGAQRAASPSRAAWTRGAVCYEVFVRSFYDSDGDGVGDLNGLIRKLDYINDGNPRSTRDLGARCIWLMPVAESPSYHGYDVTNYYRVQPAYGTNAEFKRLVTEAHRRGIRVLVDLVLNHTSSEHPNFVEALRDTASPYRQWYRWSATKPPAKGPWGEEVWHRSPVRDEYYYGVFVPTMPDLNYESPAVREEANKIARYWLTEMGVDGFRLDAVPYLVEDGDHLANTSGTHAVLHDFAESVHRVSPTSYTIGEVSFNTDSLLPYYPDQLDAYFAFEVADALIEAVKTGSAHKLLPAYLRLQKALPPERWAPFLRNHDQTRTMTELAGVGARARLAATLLLTLPGLPFVYYGEEIGMTGDKPDPQLRTPMQWTRGPAAGFTRGTAWEPVQPDSASVNVEAQNTDPGSLLNLYRQLIHLRTRNPALAAGVLEPLDANKDAVVAYVRRDPHRSVLVVANLGTTPLDGVTLSSPGGVLPGGTYRVTGLLGAAPAAPLRVAPGGSVARYAPIPSLAPLRSYIFEISRGVR